MSTIYVPKSVLNLIWKTCIQKLSDRMDSEMQTDENEYKDEIKHIWVVLARNQLGNTDQWMSYCRVSIAGLSSFFETNAAFCDCIDTILQSFNELTELELPFITVKEKIENPMTLKLSICLGYLHFMLTKKIEMTEERHTLLIQIIYDGCVKMTRLNFIYFPLLLQYAENYHHHFAHSELVDIYNLMTFHFDKKESSGIFKVVLQHPLSIFVELVFKQLMADTSWKFKIKYVLLNEILTHLPAYYANLDLTDVVPMIYHALSVPHLASPASKLYTTILNLTDYDVFSEQCYPSLCEIMFEEEITLQQQNFVKHCLPNVLKKYPTCFDKLLTDLKEKNEPSCLILYCLVLYGIHYSTLSKNFKFNRYIKMGFSHPNPLIRNMVFQILCSDAVPTTKRSLINMMTFIENNINSADQYTRDCLRKSFIIFLKKMQNTIIKLPKNPECEVAIKNYATFFNELLEFLFSNFHPSSNYQRLTASLMLFEQIILAFPRESCKMDEMTQSFALQLTIYKETSSKYYYFKCMDMLLFCGTEYRHKIMDLIFQHIFPEPLMDIADPNIINLAMELIVSCNVEEAEKGKKMMEFFVRQTSTYQLFNENILLEKINQLMFSQWQILKTSDAKSVVSDGNSLHALVSFTESLIAKYDPSKYSLLVQFVEEVVEDLLNVFKKQHEESVDGVSCCIGILLAFQDEFYRNRACTISSMWLTLKACCKLIAKIAMITDSEVYLKKTLDILFAVIQKCPHKGALEEAANCLKEIVVYTTDTYKNIHVVELFLDTFLQTIPDMTVLQTTVRRSAEIRMCLSTMAISDKRFYKPFFHKIMSFLLNELKKCIQMEESSNDTYLYHTLILHCIDPIIADNSVERHVIEYIDEAFIESLKSYSKDWRIQNAVMQTFQSCTSKILGPNIATGKKALRLVSIEEVFFKYPKIIDFIISSLRTCKPLEPDLFIIQIVSFIALSYTRGSFGYALEGIVMASLQNRLESMLTKPMINRTFIIFLRAFTSLLDHSWITTAMRSFAENTNFNSKLNPQTLFRTINAIKTLYSIVIENKLYIPFSQSLLDNCDTIMTNFSKRGKDNKNAFTLFILLVNSTEQLKIRENIDFIEQVCSQKIFRDVPGICTYMVECIEHTIPELPLNDPFAVLLIKTCLKYDNTPLKFRIRLLYYLSLRVKEFRLHYHFLSEELVDDFIHFVLKPHNIVSKIIVRFVIIILSDLNITYLSTQLKHRVLATFYRIQNGEIENYMLPVVIMCLGFEKSKFNLRVIINHCITVLNRTLNDGFEENTLVFKAVYWLIKFGCSTKIVDVLIIVYKMLQLGNWELDKECESIITLICKQPAKYPFASVKMLLDAENLEKKIGIMKVMEFYIRIYIDQDENIFNPTNVFEKPVVLTIDTKTIIDYLIMNITEVFCKQTPRERQAFLKWFQSYIKNKPHNIYIDNIFNYFETKSSHNLTVSKSYFISHYSPRIHLAKSVELLPLMS